MKPVTILTVGHVTHDRYGDRVRAGGCAFYGARTASALGARSRLMTAIGEDFSRDEELEGLDVHQVSGSRTTTFENVYSHNASRVQWVDAVAPLVTPDLLPPRWRQSDVLFLAPTMGEVELLPWLDAVRAPLVGIGLQGLMKQADGLRGHASRKVVARSLSIDPQLYSRVHAVFLSDEDLADFGHPTLLRELIRLVPIVAVTQGKRGSRVFVHGIEQRVGVVSVTSVDPTGAGDTYAAAFLFGIAQGAAAVDAARLASAAASIVVEGVAGERLRFVNESFERAERVPVSSRSRPESVGLVP